jgi:hypothetical protein
MRAVLLSGVCLVLAACASQPEVAVDPAAPVTAEVKCKPNRSDDAPTGSSIKRRDCSAGNGVQNANAEELLEQRRFTMPTGANR